MNSAESILTGLDLTYAEKKALQAGDAEDVLRGRIRSKRRWLWVWAVVCLEHVLLNGYFWYGTDVSASDAPTWLHALVKVCMPLVSFLCLALWVVELRQLRRLRGALAASER